jgi:hypothetical protein
LTESLGKGFLKGDKRLYGEGLIEAGAFGNRFDIGFPTGMGRLPAGNLILSVVPDDVNKIGRRLNSPSSPRWLISIRNGIW